MKSYRAQHSAQSDPPSCLIALLRPFGELSEEYSTLDLPVVGGVDGSGHLSVYSGHPV